MLKIAKAGKLNGYLLEGMACPGGCIAGVGTIAALGKVKRSVEKYMKEAQFKTPLENTKIESEKTKIIEEK